jgi:hypothetical protein
LVDFDLKNYEDEYKEIKIDDILGKTLISDDMKKEAKRIEWFFHF